MFAAHNTLVSVSLLPWQTANSLSLICNAQGTVEEIAQQTAESARCLPDAIEAALEAALLHASQSGLLPTASHGQVAAQENSLSDDAQYQLRLLISEGLVDAAQHIVVAQVQLTDCAFPIFSSPIETTVTYDLR